jgi:hypothetical protein
MTREEIEAALAVCERRKSQGSEMEPDIAITALRALLRAMPVIEAARAQGAWEPTDEHGNYSVWQEMCATTGEAIREHDKEEECCATTFSTY